MSLRRRSKHPSLALLLFVFACASEDTKTGSQTPPPDAGDADAAAEDSGAMDASDRRDAAPLDASSEDARSADSSRPDRGPIEEPIVEADYHVRNESSSALDVFATDLSDARVMLLVETVEAESSAHIFHAVEGSGGHALPSNFWKTFVLMQNGRRLYEGVRNEDWTMEDGDLVLVVEAGAQPPSIACTEDTECQVRDTHPQCCSTFPICVHMTEPDPLTLECPLGHSICDVQALAGCECVDNACAALYGDAGTP